MSLQTRLEEGSLICFNLSSLWGSLGLRNRMNLANGFPGTRSIVFGIVTCGGGENGQLDGYRFQNIEAYIRVDAYIWVGPALMQMCGRGGATDLNGRF